MTKTKSKSDRDRKKRPGSRRTERALPQKAVERSPDKMVRKINTVRK